MARYDDRDWDDRRDRRHAHGRYSGAQAGDDRHRQERWRHGGYGSDWQPGRDTDRDYGMDRGDYYDPDHAYRVAPLPARQRPRGALRPAADAGRTCRSPARPAHHPPAGRRGARLERAPRCRYGEGRHRGVGPKGYVRSDERIRELVCDDLMDDPWLDASGIEVAVKDGEVTLSGTVEDRDAKRWAEDVAEHTGGVKHVQNNLRVEAAH